MSLQRNRHSQVLSKYLGTSIDALAGLGTQSTYLHYVPESQLRPGGHEPRATRAGACRWEPDYLKATLELDGDYYTGLSSLAASPLHLATSSVPGAEQVAFETIAIIPTFHLREIQREISVKLFLSLTLKYSLAHSSRDHGMQTTEALQWQSFAQH
jgi:hypothetical protein